MSQKQIRLPEIEALLRRLMREIYRLEPMDSAMLTSAVIRYLAEYLHDMGVEVEISNKIETE
jgi:hypothetical protein